jgi:transcriptional regulator with XRE-family HTH domain
MITPEQCRAARILTGLSASDLAISAGIGIASVKRFESGQSVAASTKFAIGGALTRSGVIFIAEGEASASGGAGVRLAPDKS